MLRVGVMAEPPLPGRCVRKLLAAHSPEWATGLYAAMLRDTVDGLLSLDATDFLVFAPSGDDVASVLERHVPAPWKVVAGIEDPSTALALLGDTGGVAVLARSDAPSAPIDPLAAVLRAHSNADPFGVLGPSENGDAWVLGGRGIERIVRARLPWASPELAATMRVRCKESALPLEEVEPALIVDEPSAVLALIEELRRHPERAPRTAHYVVTRG